MHFLKWIEDTGFSTWVRESPSLFAYPTILFFHTVGLAFLVGPSIALVARVLGLATKLSLPPFEKFYRIMWAGFWINVVSGLVLLAADATTKLINWDFYVKLAFITVAVVVLKRLRKRLFHNPAVKGEWFVPENTKPLGIALLVCWAGAIAAGRLMAYLGPVSGAPGLNNRF
jgi:hypothetical protein